MEPTSSRVTPTPSVSIVNGKKTFVPLENNPETLSEVSLLLSLQNLSFHDIFSLTEPAVNPPIPRPVHALIFLCPRSVWTPFHSDTSSNAPPASPSAPITWFPQTIGNACGLIALVHAMISIPTSSLSNHVPSSSPLAPILAVAPNLSLDLRAKMLYDSQALERAHMSAACRGDSHVPPAEEHANHHFMCFVKGKDGHLWEIEGMRAGVKDSGPIEDGEDVLSERVVAMGPGKYVEEGRKMGVDSFSCVAVCLENGGQ